MPDTAQTERSDHESERSDTTGEPGSGAVGNLLTEFFRSGEESRVTADAHNTAQSVPEQHGGSECESEEGEVSCALS